MTTAAVVVTKKKSGDLTGSPQVSAVSLDLSSDADRHPAVFRRMAVLRRAGLSDGVFPHGEAARMYTQQSRVSLLNHLAVTRRRGHCWEEECERTGQEAGGG